MDRLTQPPTTFTRPLGVPLSPEELEAQAAEMVEAAARSVPELPYPIDRHQMWAVAATARVAGCVAIWPSTQHPVQLIPMSVWEESRRLTREAREIRLARRASVMRVVRGAA